MLALPEIKKIIEESGLNAQFRQHEKEDWDRVVKKSSFVPTVYAWDFLNYNTVYFHSFSESSTDISLVIYHDKKPCAVWPLVFDQSDKEPFKTVNKLYGGIVVPPLFVDNFPKKSQRAIIKSCINFLNDTLEVSHGECWRTNELSIEGGVDHWHQIALEMGAMLDGVNYEMYVDLSMSIEEIRSFIRKSFRPLVSSGLKNWKVTVMDQFSENTWERFRELHKKVAGRVTRSIETWDIQHEAIKSGNAFLVYVSGSDGVMVGGGYFDMSDHECNYSVGSYDRQFFDQPLGHMIQYQAILTAKEKGRKMYYIGDRFYRENLPHVTEKRVQISHFQQGFSSKIFPRVGLLFQSQEIKK
jgi:FemAB family protein